MDAAEWASFYAKIAEEFGYARAADEEAARLLATLLVRPARPAALATRLAGRDVTVLGAGPQLPSVDLAALPRPLVATDGACAALAAAGVLPDVVVTDLDGDAGAQAVFAARGALVCLAAHADNVPALCAWAPRLPGALGTTQVPAGAHAQAQAQGDVPWPPPGILATPGFTDGDRACFLAAGAGAASLTLVAFDFDEPGPSSRDPSTKRRKLAWARRLVDALPSAPRASAP